MSNFQEKIIDGRKLSLQMLVDIRQKVLKLDQTPGLAVLLIGDDPSSHLYVKLKKKACEDCNIDFHRYLFNAHTPEDEIVKVIEFLNNDPDTTGILVQLPLPEGYNTDRIIGAIDPNKDVDGFHPVNLENIKQCNLKIVSPLVLGIVELIKSTGEVIENKKITILCNHKIFGEPFHCFFDASNTIDIVTLEDADYQEKVATADILVVSIGKQQFITAEMIKQDAIIIDVGINKVNDEIFGDVDFESVISKVKYITPVPGGVGPMTISLLLENLIKLM